VPTDRLLETLADEFSELERSGASKGVEPITCEILAATGERGPRHRLEGEGDRPFLRMNSNGYLGLALHPALIEAAERAARLFGTGPQAVRFISGTCTPHVALERALARFHARGDAMIFSSAYATVMGVLPTLITPETLVISDALNHNCIINAIRLAQPGGKAVYRHLDLEELDGALLSAAGNYRRVLIVTDGVFSMRGDIAPLDRIIELAVRHDEQFVENVVVIVDDSHGVGAVGRTGRGSEESTGAQADVLIGTLGKALGANGGYVVAEPALIELLREKSPFYVYSNPIAPADAAAAHTALEIVDSDPGREMLERLRARTEQFERGLSELGYETIPGPHPVVPLMLRDTTRTRRCVAHLHDHGILATGLAYPVVPRGDEEIRFQLCADHTSADVDEALAALGEFAGR
jgi:glycine C-acetyltransferase